MGLTYKSSTETTARIEYSASFNLPTGAYNKSYSGWVGNQYVYDSSGTVTVDNLSQGAPNNINGEITCSYKYDVTTTTTTTDSNGNSTTTQTTTTYEDSKTVTFAILTVYTHPGSFNMGATSDSRSDNNIIAKVLTKSKIDDWIVHYQKAYHWKNQSSTDYNVDLSVTVNEPVTSTWFNKCMVAMNKLGKNYKTDYKGGPNGDLITATIINQMNFVGTS